jgi:hypothetical protein
MIMSGLNVFSATTAMPAAWISSGLHPIATITGLRREDDELVTTALSASLASFNLHRVSQMRSRPARARRLIWFRLQPALSVGGISPTLEPTRKPAEPAPATAPLIIEPPATEYPSAAFAAGTVIAPPGMPAPKPPSAISRVELTIDSLRTYDLSRPIPVVVESLGERNYVAEMPDLNISVSASNPSEIIIALKNRIAQVYDGLRILKHLDAEQARHLKILETYIVRTRRGWLDRR